MILLLFGKSETELVAAPHLASPCQASQLSLNTPETEEVINADETEEVINADETEEVINADEKEEEIFDADETGAGCCCFNEKEQFVFQFGCKLVCGGNTAGGTLPGPDNSFFSHIFSHSHS